MANDRVRLPDGLNIEQFVPVAYYDKHMDCIRVITHDRSVTEVRIDEFLTIHECNHKEGDFDPDHTGYTIKGVRHLFDEMGLSLSGIHTLVKIIDLIVKHRPASSMAQMLTLIHKKSPPFDATVDLGNEVNQAA